MWGLGIGDWAMGNPQSPIPNPQKILISISSINISYYNIYYILNKYKEHKNLSLNKYDINKYKLY